MENLSNEEAGKLLGVTVDANETQVRAAYLSKVKEYPPERCPEEFQRVRASYELLRSPRERARRRFSELDPARPILSLLEEIKPTRRFLGPLAWTRAMKGQ